LRKRKVLSLVFILSLVIPFSLLIPNGDSEVKDFPATFSHPLAVADSFEEDDDFNNPSSILVNTTQVRSIFPIADPDYVTFELQHYSEVIIKTNETTGDTRIWLYDYARNQLNFDNDNPDDLNATIEYAYLKPGTYFIRIEENGNDEEIDNYSLSVKAATVTDPYEPDECFNPTFIHLNSTISKSIYPYADWDFFQFELANTYNITIETTGLAGDTVLDLRTICDEDGSILVENDDKGDGTLFSKVNYTNLPPGTYYIKVYGYWDWSLVHEYTLHLSVNTSWLSETDAPVFQGNALALSDTVGPSAAMFYTWLYDFFGISEVKLHYRVNAGSWNHVDMVSHYYNNYSISAGLFEHLDFVEYYFTAKDNSSNYNSAIDDNGGNYYNFTIIYDEFDEPIIDSISHSPASPNDAEVVTINCSITDYSGIEAASVIYRIDFGDWEEEEVPMIYDGNDIYLATTGPFGYDEFVEYYIKAIDNSVNYNEAVNNNSGLYYHFTIGPSDLIPPVISNIGHTPENPVGREPVEFTCDVTDASGLQSVKLNYNINNEIFFNELEMTLRSGNTYNATLDFLNQGDYVQYFIYATDNSAVHNVIWDDNDGEFYTFIVGTPPPTSTETFILYLFPVVIAVVFVALKRKKK
jgi:hypothetical protein